ncbi:MAG: hypothetical protein HY700_13280 [Gemmatimonadetes bacterium]|nr:hypothetical protein [Gemmatimonadota bacterium]
MILANLRERLTAADIQLAIDLLARGSSADRRYYTELVEEEGPDRLLDDPDLMPLLGSHPQLTAPSAPLFLYVTLRHALRNYGVDDARLADYLGALVLDFGMRDRAYRVSPHDDDTRRYLVDIVADLSGAEGRRAFLLCAHLGNFSLWLSGIFPDYITAQNARKGAPGFAYYDEMGTLGFRRAADHGLARELEMDAVYASVADLFARIRVALNQVSDRVFFPNFSSPDRLMRQVSEEFKLSA